MLSKNSLAILALCLVTSGCTSLSNNRPFSTYTRPGNPGVTFDSVGACYPSELILSQQNHPFIAIHRVTNPEDYYEEVRKRLVKTSTYKRVYAFSIPGKEVCHVFVNKTGDYLDHEIGHCLGVTKHHCTGDETLEELTNGTFNDE